MLIFTTDVVSSLKRTLTASSTLSYRQCYGSRGMLVVKDDFIHCFRFAFSFCFFPFIFLFASPNPLTFTMPKKKRCPCCLQRVKAKCHLQAIPDQRALTILKRTINGSLTIKSNICDSYRLFVRKKIISENFENMVSRKTRYQNSRHNARLCEALTQRRALYLHFFEFFLEIFTRHS